MLPESNNNSNTCSKKWHRRRQSSLAIVASIATVLATTIITLRVNFRPIHDERPQSEFSHTTDHKAPHHVFSTSDSSWSIEQVEQYELDNTPKEDPNLTYFPRVLDQARAEIANTEEVVRYITNTDDIDGSFAAGEEHPFVLLIRVLVSESSSSIIHRRWEAILKQFEVPDFLSIRIQYVSFDDDADGNSNLPIKKLFGYEEVDWVFIVHGSTYVHLSRLTQRLFADVDPSQNIKKSLIVPFDSIYGKVSVPSLESGILFTRPALKEMWNHNDRSESCWKEHSVSRWSACLSQKIAFVWTPMTGLNPINVRKIMESALGGSLFDSDSRYTSVGGAITGTARLPITYADMNDELFYKQLDVDAHQGKVPKILHHIWSGPMQSMNNDIKEAAETCQKIHEEAGWEYILWNDTMVEQLPGFPKIPTMKDPKMVRHYTDVIRYYILHQFGGVYIDMDAYCLRPFDPLLKYAYAKHKDFLLNYESQRHKGRQLANGILVSAPSSPVLSAIILHLGNRLRKHFTKKDISRRKQAFKLTGPWVISEVRDQWESWTASHIAVLASNTFIPLYKNEGHSLQSRSNVFEFAKSQGSYAVQMYHHGSLMHLLKSEAVEARPNRNLMIVAHPDDEIIWGGNFLLAEGSHTQVIVTSTHSEDAETRHKEFKSVEKHLGYHGIFLNGTDSTRLSSIEPHIQRYIQESICSLKKWDKIITHGPEGEYGHPQHQLVFDVVYSAVKKCPESLQDLYVFEPHPTPDHSFPEAKMKVAGLYTSQRDVVKKFGKWKEQIVRLADYDYVRASKDCLMEAKKHKTRKCRVNKMIDLSSVKK